MNDRLAFSFVAAWALRGLLIVAILYAIDGVSSCAVLRPPTDANAADTPKIDPWQRHVQIPYPIMVNRLDRLRGVPGWAKAATDTKKQVVDGYKPTENVYTISAYWHLINQAIDEDDHRIAYQWGQLSFLMGVLR